MKKMHVTLRAVIVCVATQSPTSSAWADEKPMSASTVPLKTIISTSQQSALKWLWGSDDSKLYAAFGHLRPAFKTHRFTNILMLEADTPLDALTAAGEAYAGRFPADKPIPWKAGVRTKKKWLLVYLGTSSSEPPFWLFESIAITGMNIRVTYKNNESNMGGTNDEVPYLYWVPLGDLPAGGYVLELFDANQKEVTLARRVTVAYEKPNR